MNTNPKTMKSQPQTQKPEAPEAPITRTPNPKRPKHENAGNAGVFVRNLFQVAIGIETNRQTSIRGMVSNPDAPPVLYPEPQTHPTTHPKL